MELSQSFNMQEQFARFLEGKELFCHREWLMACLTEAGKREFRYQLETENEPWLEVRRFRFNDDWYGINFGNEVPITYYLAVHRQKKVVVSLKETELINFVPTIGDYQLYPMMDKSYRCQRVLETSLKNSLFEEVTSLQSLYVHLSNDTLARLYDEMKYVYLREVIHHEKPYLTCISDLLYAISHFVSHLNRKGHEDLWLNASVLPSDDSMTYLATTVEALMRQWLETTDLEVENNDNIDNCFKYVLFKLFEAELTERFNASLSYRVLTAIQSVSDAKQFQVTTVEGKTLTVKNSCTPSHLSGVPFEQIASISYKRKVVFSV